MSFYGNELTNKYLENNSDYLNESLKDDLAPLDEFIKSLFGHTLKFIYQRQRQSRSWILSIRNSHVHIVEIIGEHEKAAISKITKDGYLDKIYKRALNFASKETGIFISEPRPSDWDENFIQDRNKIMNLLLEYAINDKVKGDILYEFKQI
jgi:hypothetical protein